MTVIETLVAVTASLVLGSIAIPSMVRTYQNYRVDAASRQFVSALQAARFMSVMRQGKYGVQFNSTNRTFEVVSWNRNTNTWQSLAAKDLNAGKGYDSFSNRKTIAPNVTISATGLGSSNVVAFNEKGELMNSTSSAPTRYASGSSLPTITVTVGAKTRNILVTRFGNLKVMNPAKSLQM